MSSGRQYNSAHTSETFAVRAIRRPRNEERGAATPGSIDASRPSITTVAGPITYAGCLALITSEWSKKEKDEGNTYPSVRPPTLRPGTHYDFGACDSVSCPFVPSHTFLDAEAPSRKRQQRDFPASGYLPATMWEKGTVVQVQARDILQTLMMWHIASDQTQQASGQGRLSETLKGDHNIPASSAVTLHLSAYVCTHGMMPSQTLFSRSVCAFQTMFKGICGRNGRAKEERHWNEAIQGETERKGGGLVF